MTRNARLDALRAAVVEWRTTEISRLDREVASAKKILAGRTGADRLPAQAQGQLSALIVDELDEFLVDSSG
jgi:hypothetical protein